MNRRAGALKLRRVPLLAAGIISLLAALWAALLRLGFEIPAPQPALPAVHGPLMVSGFLGTLISLERSVALGEAWAYAAPALTGLGALALIAGVGGAGGPLLIVLGSLALCVDFAVIVRRQAELFTVAMALGAVAWLAGNVLWFEGRSIPDVVTWWIGFFVLTIAGERLELGRMRGPVRGSQTAFAIAAAAVIAGLLGLFAWPAAAPWLLGLGMIGCGAWVLAYDVVRKTIRQAGLPRFAAINLLAGAVWLMVGGALRLWFPVDLSVFQYDAILHCVFLGYVFSMIFAHAPIIFPAILGRPLPLRNAFYAHVVLLQFSLVLRVGADLGGWFTIWQWAGALNVAAILLFLGNTVAAIAMAGAASGPAVVKLRGKSRTVSGPAEPQE